MNLDYYFCEGDNPKTVVSQPVKYGYLIKYAFSMDEVCKYFAILSTLPWRLQEVIVGGNPYIPKRETLGFADETSDHLLENRSAKSMFYPRIFYELRYKIRKIIMDNIGEIEQVPQMNYCWGNRYRNGHDKVGKHKDDETYHSKTDPIVSVSFGIYRYFDIYMETKRIERLNLGFGDIFLMMPGFQHAYYHGVPQQKRVVDPRINLTFRTIDSRLY